MLERITNTPVNYGKLKNAGVSPEGIHFVSRMLVVDPGLRATEIECLKNPWLSKKQIKGVVSLPGVVGVPRSLGSIGEDQEEESATQMSQLSLVANPRQVEIRDSDLEYDTDVDEIEDTRRSKRFKFTHTPNHREKQRGSSSGIVEFPSLPDDEHVDAAQENACGVNRLFGEIGASALRSSGVLDYNAHTALQIHLEDESHGFTESLSSTPSDAPTSNLVNGGGVIVDGYKYLPHPRRPQTLSAPSLLGTEALVGQLNMASSESNASAASPQSKSATPANSAFYGSDVPDSKRPGQAPHSSDQANAKRAKTDNAQESSNLTSYGSSAFAGAIETYDKLNTRGPKAQSQDDGGTSKTDLNRQAPNQQDLDADGHAVVTQAVSSSSSSDIPASGSTAKHHPFAGKADFARPRPRLGILTTLSGSVCNTTIKLDQRWTSYGRDPACHVKYPNSMDVRVPRAAFDILFWRPGLEDLIRSGAKWDEVDGIFPIVTTRTSLHIRVNGFKLQKGKDCWLYGRLHTGDVITVFGSSDEESTTGKNPEFLRFRCEFFSGPSAKERAQGSAPFVVEREVEKFQKYQISLSNGGQGNSGDHQGESNGRPRRPDNSHVGTRNELATTTT